MRRSCYLHVVHDELEEPSQGAAFLLDTRIHLFSTSSKKKKEKKTFTNFFFFTSKRKEKNNFQPKFLNTPKKT